MASPTLINAFLHFGYLPRPDRALAAAEALAAVLREGFEFSSVDREAQLAEAADTLRACIRDHTEMRHVVPLSSGLDSRAVLALVLDSVEPSRVETATFGSPGTWDFDLAPKIARELGLPHTHLDLRDIPVDVDGLSRVAESGAAWTFLLDAYFNRLLAEQAGSDAVFWSGFLGDALTGAHLPPTPSPGWSEATMRFEEWSAMAPRELGGSREGAELLPHGPDPSLPMVGPDDQLDFLVRQPSYVRPVVMPEGFAYVSPFETSDVQRLFLALPLNERHRQRFYRDLISQLAPRLGHFAGSATLGISPEAGPMQRRVQRVRLRALEFLRKRFPLVRWPIHPATNYLDLDAAFRRREDFIQLAAECLPALRERRVVGAVDPVDLWQRHRAGTAAAGTALMLLCALEISLRVEPEPLSSP